MSPEKPRPTPSEADLKAAEIMSSLEAEQAPHYTTPDDTTARVTEANQTANAQAEEIMDTFIRGYTEGETEEEQFTNTERVLDDNDETRF